MIQISGGKSALWWEQKIQNSGDKCDKYGLMVQGQMIHNQNYLYDNMTRSLCSEKACSSQISYKNWDFVKFHQKYLFLSNSTKNS